MRARRRGDRGQAVALLLAVVALVVVMMVATARFAVRVQAREQAQVAADAAALAGVSYGPAGAQRLAAANGGVVVSFVATGDEVLVVVRVRGETASARATRAP
ncbi:MAG: hypothetical protein Q7V88_13540 [Actinomycetota bacterium]|nr:hypothetical protein [Actinomycetota bacterium]